MDYCDDYLSADIVALHDHRKAAGILELWLEHYNDDKSWHSIELVKNEDPHAVANYVIATILDQYTAVLANAGRTYSLD